MPSDRIFGLVTILVACIYGASATRIESSFLADPVGPRTFPVLVALAAAICGGVLCYRPAAGADWPDRVALFRISLAAALLIAYAFALRPLGFILPTAAAAALLSYQINPRPLAAALAGVALSVVLFVVFKNFLGLGLVAFSRHLTG